MRKHCDFSRARRNPYAKRLKRQATIRLDEETLTYFRKMGERLEIPYQTLINTYLRDCADSHKELSLKWTSGKGPCSPLAARGQAPSKLVLKVPQSTRSRGRPRRRFLAPRSARAT